MPRASRTGGGTTPIWKLRRDGADALRAATILAEVLDIEHGTYRSTDGLERAARRALATKTRPGWSVRIVQAVSGGIGFAIAYQLLAHFTGGAR